MKRILRSLAPVAAALFAVVLTQTHAVRAQNNVGINTSSPAPSAELDLTSTSQGFLVPRMSTTSKLAITSPATGLLVYDNTLNTFYYYNSTAWVPFLSTSGGATGWLLTGNAGTSAATNFIGTIDTKDFVMRTNNTEGMRLTSAGLLAVGTTTATQKFEDAGNMRIDPLAGVASQLQFVNPAGTFASTFAAGAQSAVINYTLPIAQGAAGTALINNGSGVLSWGSAPTSSWLLTGNAGTTAGTNFIGTTDLKDFVLKTNNFEYVRLTSGGKVGIGTTAPSQMLEVAGNALISPVTGVASTLMFTNPAGTFTTTFQAGAQASSINYTLPLAQGAANTVLTNNGSGVLSWAAPGSLNWSLVGNAGTTAGTNFEGTTDNVDMVWKTNSIEGMRLTAAQNLGIGTNAPTSKLQTVASGAKTISYTGNLLTNTATSSTASITKTGTDIQSTGSWTGASAVNVGLNVNADGGTTDYSATFQGGNVGVNTTAPAAYADINGDMSYRYSTFTATNGDNDDIAIGAYTFIRIGGPTAAYAVTGIAGGVDGKIVILFNSTSQSFTVSNENTGSVAADRIWTLNSAGDIVITGMGIVKLMYSTADSRWIVVGQSSSEGESSTGLIFAKKPVDESVSSSTTLQNDNDLVLPISANDSMVVEGYIHYHNTGSGSLRMAITVPSGATMDIALYTDDVVVGDPETWTLTTSGTSTGNMFMNAVDVPVHFYGVVITAATSGNIQIQWAQGSSSSTPTTFKAKSYIRGTLIR